jgi:hypothetical protein
VWLARNLTPPSSFGGDLWKFRVKLRNRRLDDKNK